MHFSGSYRKEQVTFLLKPIEMELMSNLKEKETLIQLGKKHYSEMLSPEKAPSEKYSELFEEAFSLNKNKMAEDCLNLAKYIQHKFTQDRPVIVSLARAGTPIGVILKQILSNMYGEDIKHYSISIIRDRGIDKNALKYILSTGIKSENIIFIDGWTGKGVIARELEKSIKAFNIEYHQNLNHKLLVLSDLAGVSEYAPTIEDYLIPSAILNSTISGLVSRSILNEKIAENDFHGCVYWGGLSEYDISQKFADDITEISLSLNKDELYPNFERAEVYENNQKFIYSEMNKYGVKDQNLIKPGIGESTRVLLRRYPSLIILREKEDISVQHLIQLANEKNVPIETNPNLFYRATAIIRDMSND